jgi:hypothetical protein
MVVQKMKIFLCVGAICSRMFQEVKCLCGQHYTEPSGYCVWCGKKVQRSSRPNSGE